MRIRSARRGATAIEFSLVMALGFVPFMFAIIEWSWYFFQATLVNNALQNAARVGVSYDHTADGVCPTDRAETALSEALSGWNFSGVDITSTTTSDMYGEDPPQSVEQLTLTVSVPYEPIIVRWWAPSTMGGTVTVPFEVQVACS